MGEAVKKVRSLFPACLSVVCPECGAGMVSCRFEHVVRGKINDIPPASDRFRCPNCGLTYRAEVKYERI